MSHDRKPRRGPPCSCAEQFENLISQLELLNTRLEELNESISLHLDTIKQSIQSIATHKL